MAVVMSVAALDSYLHAAVLRRIANVRGSQLPKALRRLDMPFGEIAELADYAVCVQANRTKWKPWVHVKRVLQERLLRETFQSSNQVAMALNMCGITDSWGKLATDMGATAPALQKRLDTLVHRRNQIVHEGDVARAARPRKLKFNNVEEASVRADVDWMEKLIESIDDRLFPRQTGRS
jgi:hypothetical protein